MTQQPYQQYPPQPQGPPPGWPPAAPQGPPPGWPPAAPPAATYATPSAPAPAPDGGDPWGVPTDRPAAGDAPTLAQLAQSSRLILVRPLRWKPGATKYNSDEPEEQMIVDLIVCDGPPIAGHEDFTSRVVTPFATGPKVAPFFIGEMMVNKAVLDRLRDTLINPASPDIALGRLSANKPKSGSGFPWWNLEVPTEEDKAIARPIFPRWDELKAAAAAPPAGPVSQGPPPAWAQAPVPQADPANWQQAGPAAPQGPPPGWPPAAPQGPPPSWNGQPPY